MMMVLEITRGLEIKMTKTKILLRKAKPSASSLALVPFALAARKAKGRKDRMSNRQRDQYVECCMNDTMLGKISLRLGRLNQSLGHRGFSHLSGRALTYCKDRDH